MTEKIRTAIFISGRGSNMEALINACKEEKNFPAEIKLVIANKNAKGLIFAESQSIKIKIISNEAFKNRLDFEQEIHQELLKNNIQLICLAGFMRILSEWFVKKWEKRIINIHPSLLPKFKGANAVKNALIAKEKTTGCTTHFVTAEVDSGLIIKQSKVAILSTDTEESLATRILTQEHLIYKETLKIVAENIINNNFN
ncbi:MAG: phosphoribosylglycinamide formyltransferase [Rickettsiales bacterium]|jgi:phosphoribosylglycinamide formyltransferase-1|nr:phosphoribosylglycinamide formyltransferase [Rickettsiales bacterium]